jgi:ParB-like chromosome segregation protein Spo0J
VNVETVPIDSIHVDPANANAHSEEDVVGLMAKLATFEQVEPLVVQTKTRKVIGGNGRLEAMRRLGWTEVDVHLVDVDNVTATAMGIALNTRKSHLIEERLAEQLKALQAAVGYSDDELQGLIDGLANDVLGSETDGKEYDESVVDEVKYCECPSCGHKWPA